MTACVIITHENGIEAFTDGSAFDSNGVCGYFCNKLRLMPQIPALVFARGAGMASDRAQTYFSRFPSYDEMVKYLPLGVSLSTLQANEQADEVINLGVVIAGYSESTRAWQAHHCSVREEGGQLVDGSLAVSALPNFYAEPWPDEERLVAAGLSPLSAFQWEHTVESGVAFLEAVRATPMRLHTDSDAVGSLAGGFVEHTVLTADGATARIVHRWSDQLDRKIGEAA